MLQADEVVTAIRREAERPANAFQGIWRERDWHAAHAREASGSGSIVTNNGNSWRSASCRVSLTFVSATSRV